MGQVTTLIELIRKYESLDGQATIYAAEPWACDSPALVEVEPASGGLPPEASRHELKYFIEVSVARDFLADWESGLKRAPTERERCERLIDYAVNDA